MLARAPIVLRYANSFYSFDTLMSCLNLYSAKNVEILRNKRPRGLYADVFFNFAVISLVSV